MRPMPPSGRGDAGLETIADFPISKPITRHYLRTGGPPMADAEVNQADNKSENRPFEADVAKLLQLMVHSVYSDKSVFLRELIANAADACERLRYEAIADPALLGDDPKPHITVALDADAKTACRRRQRHRHEPR